MFFSIFVRLLWPKTEQGLERQILSLPIELVCWLHKEMSSEQFLFPRVEVIFAQINNANINSCQHISRKLQYLWNLEKWIVMLLSIMITTVKEISLEISLRLDSLLTQRPDIQGLLHYRLRSILKPYNSNVRLHLMMTSWCSNNSLSRQSFFFLVGVCLVLPSKAKKAIILKEIVMILSGCITRAGCFEATDMHILKDRENRKDECVQSKPNYSFHFHSSQTLGCRGYLRFASSPFLSPTSFPPLTLASLIRLC